MRVTQGMVTNNMLANISNNANKVNTVYQALASGQQIQSAHEDPIMASRALRFSTSISQTEQYQKNADYGLNWMSVTDQAFNNVTDIMVHNYTELITQGATNGVQLDEQKMIATEIDSLFDQIKSEMNVTYSGRYVFSGYKTDEPPILTEDISEKYPIKQNFSYEDMEETYGYQKTDAGKPSEITEISVIRMAYDNVDGAPAIESEDGTLYSTTQKSINDAGAYEPGPGEVYYIQETGELVLGEDVVENLRTNDFTVSYEKTGFKEGELNPEVYFNSESQDMEYEIGVGSTIKVNSEAADVFTPQMYAKLKHFNYIFETMEVSSEDAIRADLEASGLSGDELETAIAEQLEAENNNVEKIGFDLFNDLGEINSDYQLSVSTQHTDLGTRMNRLELINDRLAEDYISYSELYSQTIETDYTKSAMELTTANSVYQASLQVGAQVMQISLINYM